MSHSPSCPSTTAYLLVSHGSSDPRPQQMVEQLAALLRHRLVTVSPRELVGSIAAVPGSGLPNSGLPNSGLPNSGLPNSGLPGSELMARQAGVHWGVPHSISPLPGVEDASLVATATLELAEQPLHQQILSTADLALATGYTRLCIVPLFLLPGVHTMDDIPAEVAIAQTQLANRILIDLCPYLGSHPGLLSLMQRQMHARACDRATAQRILLSHGSRRPGGNHPVEAIATQLKASPAYWSVPPNLETRITQLIQTGSQEILILPYFLFPGGITDAIAHQIADFAQQFPNVALWVCPPIGNSPDLVELVLDLVRHPAMEMEQRRNVR